MISKLPKSTYYDKFGPSGIYTEGNYKITEFFKHKELEESNKEPNDLQEILNETSGDDNWKNLNINKFSFYN